MSDCGWNLYDLDPSHMFAWVGSVESAGSAHVCVGGICGICGVCTCLLNVICQDLWDMLSYLTDGICMI